MKLFKNVPELFIEMLEIHNSDITNNINVLQNAFQWFGSAIWGIQKGGGFNLKGGFMGRLGQLSKSLIETIF